MDKPEIESVMGDKSNDTDTVGSKSKYEPSAYVFDKNDWSQEVSQAAGLYKKAEEINQAAGNFIPARWHVDENGNDVLLPLRTKTIIYYEDGSKSYTFVPEDWEDWRVITVIHVVDGETPSEFLRGAEKVEKGVRGGIYDMEGVYDEIGPKESIDRGHIYLDDPGETDNYVMADYEAELFGNPYCNTRVYPQKEEEPLLFPTPYNRRRTEEMVEKMNTYYSGEMRVKRGGYKVNGAEIPLRRKLARCYQHRSWKGLQDYFIAVPDDWSAWEIVSLMHLNELFTPLEESTGEGRIHLMPENEVGLFDVDPSKQIPYFTFLDRVEMEEPENLDTAIKIFRAWAAEPLTGVDWIPRSWAEFRRDALIGVKKQAKSYRPAGSINRSKSRGVKEVDLVKDSRIGAALQKIWARSGKQ